MAKFRGQMMTIDALGTLEKSPEVLKTRARTIEAIKSMLATLAPMCGSVPPQHRAPARAEAPPPAPRQDATANPMYGAAGRDYSMMPSLSQPKLSIRKFDETELNKGLSRNIFDCRRTFLRAVNLADVRCTFEWTEDVSVDLLKYFLVGIAESICHIQVDA